MTDFDEYPDETTSRDAQRQTLAELIRLATECVSLDASLQKSLDQTIEQARKALANESHRLAGDVEAKIESENANFAQSMGRIDRERADLVRALSDKSATQHQRLLGEYDNATNKVKKEYQDARWLADSVMDSAILHANTEYKSIVEKSESDRVELENVRADGIKRLQSLGYQSLGLIEHDEVKSNVSSSDFDAMKQAAMDDVQTLRTMTLPRWFVGATPLGAIILVVAAAVAVTMPWKRDLATDWKPPVIAGVVALVVTLMVGLLLNALAARRVKAVWSHLLDSISSARGSIETRLAESTIERDQKIASAKSSREEESNRIKTEFQPLLDKAKTWRDDQLRKLNALIDAEKSRIEKKDSEQRSQLESSHKHALNSLNAERDERTTSARQLHDQAIQRAQSEFETKQSELKARWERGLEQTRASSTTSNAPGTIRFGSLTIDLARIATEAGANHSSMRLTPPPPYEVPAWLAMPRQASLLIEHDRSGRESAVDLLRATVTSLLTTIEPGRAKFTFIDPVGLGQSFAAFMHLADFDDSLVTGRIWSEQQQIEQRLTDLTEHMETVIQKYLRNEFDTIDQYNAQAGELAEPYRFLVIADLPTSFSDESLRRLANIATSGARCGVYVLVTRDVRAAISQPSLLEDLIHSCTVLVQKDGRFVWRDDVLGRFDFTPIEPLNDSALTPILHDIGQRAKQNKRIAVPFSTIAPSSEQMWSLEASSDVGVPVGRTGATRLQHFRLGRGVAQHALIAGKTGSGKSTLLNVLITNLGLWYSPDEVELYLIDFKRGVEFKAYATHRMPHARAIAVESDREFGLSVLQRLDAELARRGDLFRKVGAQDLMGYRKASEKSDPKLPRQILIVDEFQELFSEDDKLSQEASQLIDRLVRQGRAFGIHVVLGSQTIAGSQGVPRATFGQMAVRVALQCTEADSQLILGDNNSAARLLSRPGEAIYNDAGGAVENNSPFQVSWLSDETREGLLDQINNRAKQSGYRHPGVAIFEGNAPAVIEDNVELAQLIESSRSIEKIPSTLKAMLGEAVAIKPATSVLLRARAGANILVIGQQDEQALAVLASGVISIAAQAPRNSIRLILLDATPADSVLANRLNTIYGSLGFEIVDVAYRDASDAVVNLGSELGARRDGTSTDSTPIFLIINGLHRYRDLRKREESFNFSMDDDKPKSTPPDKALAEILRDGPSFNIHAIAWIDTLAALDRTFERGTLREFDHRVLFQMSASDSAMLIDSAAANKLGSHRAIYYSEELGVIEKFRPYAIPNDAFRDRVKNALAR